MHERNDGRWLVRIEDLDRAARGRRIRRPTSCERCEAFGFEWDGAVVRQTDRDGHYAAAHRAPARPRPDLRMFLQPAQIWPNETAIPGTCREAR